MKEVVVFACIWISMISMSFWESYVEGRKAWDKGKSGWKLKIGSFSLTAYHFYIFWIMFPSLLILPIILNGWDKPLLGIVISAYFSGMILQDFMWYVVNPKVKFKELYSDFSDYYPWIRLKGIKIIPVGYVVGIVLSILSWYFIWR